MTSSRKDSLAVLALLGLLGLFFPDLFLVRSAPLIGDSLEQHYPWALQLAHSLKSFKLPFWTPFVQCGFPLVAESQIGAFYLPNLFLLGLLPFRAAYSYMNLLHWFIAGWGTYAYARQMKLESMAAFVAAVVFVFGGAYGGAYYNMTSLKTICWFPVALYFFERYLDGGKKRFLLGMALVIGQSLVAGYLQMAVLTWLIFAAYLFLRIFLFPENPAPVAKKTLTLAALTVTALSALLIALPQIYLTFQLAMISNRAGLEEGYAYVGSMSPIVFGTLIIPKLSLIMRGNNLYAGSFALFLVIFSFCSPDIRKSKVFKLWSVMALLALLLALGRWSPLYIALIKLTKFYAFRFPAKFIGFICFGIAMLSAAGFQSLWQGSAVQAVVKKALQIYLAIMAGFVGLMVSGNLLLTAGRDFAMKLGEFYVMRFVYAKPGHAHSLEAYLERVRSYPDYALQYISLNDPVNIWMVAMFCFCAVLLAVFLWKKSLAKFLLCVGVFFLTIDLYAASYLDIQLDLASYGEASTSSPVLNRLIRERAAGRVGRVYGFCAAGRRLPLIPSQNMLYRIEDIGVYSPLVSKRYNESIGLLGNVNDSNTQQFPSLDFALQRLPLLNFLNVSHVVSSEPVAHAGLKLVEQNSRPPSYLYEIANGFQPAFFVGQAEVAEDWEALRSRLMTPGFDPRKILLLEKEEFKKIPPFDPGIPVDPPSTFRLKKRRADFEEWQIETAQAGFFVVPETFYVGWKAVVNGQPAPLLKADGLFRAIRIGGPGSYKLQFWYKPFSRE